MATLGLGDPESFPFLDPPDTRLINDGVRLLEELQAMDGGRRVTGLGRQIAALPVDPRLGRMLLAASRQRCLAEMLVDCRVSRDTGSARASGRHATAGG